MGATRDRADDLVGLLADLVTIDSVNPTLVGGGAGEASMAQYVAATDLYVLADDLVEEAARAGQGWPGLRDPRRDLKRRYEETQELLAYARRSVGSTPRP